MSDKTIYADTGENFWEFIARVKKYLDEEYHYSCHIVFNDVLLTCYVDSNVDDMYDKFSLQNKLKEFEKAYRR